MEIFHPRLTGIPNSKIECRVYITTGPEVQDMPWLWLHTKMFTELRYDFSMLVSTVNYPPLFFLRSTS